MQKETKASQTSDQLNTHCLNEKSADGTLKSFPFSTTLLFQMTASIFIIEASVMFLLQKMPPFSPVLETLLDAALLSVMILPCFYFFINRAERKISRNQDVGNKTFETNIMLKYSLGLGFIAVLAFVGYLSVYKAATHWKEDLRVISRSDKQRTLSQRAAILSMNLIHSQEKKAEREHVRKQMRYLADTMEESHEWLISGKPYKNLQGETSAKARTLHFEPPRLQNISVQKFVKEIRALANMQDAALTHDNPHLQNIMAYAQGELIDSLTYTANWYREKSIKETETALNVGIITMLLILLALSVEGLFIFWPMTRRIKEEAMRLRKSEREVNEARKMLQLALNTIPVRVFWKDANLNYLGCNILFAKDAGFDSPDDIIGKSDFDLPWKEQAELYRADDHAVIESGQEKINFEEPLVTPDGGKLWLRTSKVPLSNYSGETIGVMGTYDDITTKKQAEEKIKESATLYRTLFDQSPDGIVIIDIENELPVMFNDKVCEHLGYSREEFSKLKMDNYAISESLEDLKEYMETTLGDDHFIFETQHRTKNGEMREVLIMSKRLTLGERKILHNIYRDITDSKKNEEEFWKTQDELEARIKDATSELMSTNEYLKIEVTDRKRVENELREAHSETEQMLTAIPSFFIGLDSQNRITKWNHAAEITFGKKPSEVMLAPFAECGIQWDWDEVIKKVDTCRNKRQVEHLDNFSYTNLDGKDGFLRISFTCVSVDSDKTCIPLVFGADITEQKYLESQLSQAQKLESIGQLAAGIAHEINTPTQFVGDNIRFLQDAFTDIGTLLEKNSELFATYGEVAGCKEFVRDMEQAMEKSDMAFICDEAPQAIQAALRGVDRIATIVRAMKEFSHPGTKEKTPIDINKAIESTITVARNEWKYIAEMEMDFDKSLPLVPCLPGDFNQVILNLITNAAHAISKAAGNDQNTKGKITITSRNKNDFAEISVSDTGTGIPADIIEKIFDPFFTTKEVGKGTGQGLALSRSVIVDKHGGTIKVKTEEGKGTTFIISLPMKG
ncbi:diguanylate cyclase/phosphodiesterase (GGDEF & EAL domains) with PAS/PAC sensor(s) [hydrothermal vent metagenome]|uniref:Diguanylate cyclase/phosphodiesterase (GGDEF & EAL domains) with PAS/PAC sensor(S) n=1 Tax=hydrothermal vent metagenome TaxID=652676 RepID=A0A3B1BPC9_9ZZZZ